MRVQTETTADEITSSRSGSAAGFSRGPCADGFAFPRLALLVMMPRRAVHVLRVRGVIVIRRFKIDTQRVVQDRPSTNLRMNGVLRDMLPSWLQQNGWA